MSEPSELRVTGANDPALRSLPVGSIVHGINGTSTPWRKTAEGVLLKVREPQHEGQTE